MLWNINFIICFTLTAAEITIQPTVEEALTTALKNVSSWATLMPAGCQLLWCIPTLHRHRPLLYATALPYADNAATQPSGDTDSCSLPQPPRLRLWHYATAPSTSTDLCSPPQPTSSTGSLPQPSTSTGLSPLLQPLPTGCCNPLQSSSATACCPHRSLAQPPMGLQQGWGQGAGPKDYFLLTKEHKVVQDQILCHV